ncbi:MAG: sulfatase-like hydrolase/transferase [Chitinivibrionales bacterium]|nr:sulfatase-like hydrolase/transferase [Chitinivibrionales bacterium]
MADRPNIVWFITDDTSDEMLGYAGGTVLTPHIDRIAREGVVCTQYHTSSPACCPSRYSYLTGKHPGHCPDPRFTDAYPKERPYEISFNVYAEPTTPTVASLLRDKGYLTGFTGKWHVGSSRRSLNDHTYRPDDDPADPATAKKLRQDYEAMQAEVRGVGFDYADGIAWGNTDNRPLRALQYHNLEWHTQHALAFLDQAKTSDKPFFLNMATTTIHGPHHIESLETDGRATEWGLLDEAPDVQPSRASVFERLRAADIEVTHRSAGALWTDDAFGAVMKRVEELGLADNTIFIFSTDHGVGVTSGKFTCYQGGVRIPHAMKWDGHIQPGTTCDALLQNVDFLPTLLDMAGVAPPRSVQLDGTSKRPLLEGKARSTDEELYFEWGLVRAIRTRRYKYIAFRPRPEHIEAMSSGEAERAYNYRGGLGADHCMHHYPHYFEADQLYDLDADPGEQNNLATNPAHATLLRDMQSRLSGHLKTFSHPFSLSVAPFLKSDEYRSLVKPHLEDERIFQTYFYLQHAY